MTDDQPTNRDPIPTADAADLSPLKRALIAIQDLKARLERAEGGGEPLAIVGIGCRLAGGVDGSDRYWDLLSEGREGIVDVPADRWDIEYWYDSDRAAPGKMNMRKAGFLRDGVDRFDAAFFGIAPREASTMDPQQRLLLELAWEALEDGGIAPDRMSGLDCGVFVGLYNSNYPLAARGSPIPEGIDGWSASGGHTSVAAGRVSYTLGLTGPSLAVDTACSSSLVAVHLAARAIQTGECRMALAGGVHLILAPESLVASTKLGATAADGRCKTFDASADGFGHGEGGGLVVLKRLSDALADGDPIHAVIRGSAVNQDGKSNSLTAPNGPAQQAVIETALKRAGLQGRQVGYVEAHGTGTGLGDPIEIEAIVGALATGRTDPLMVGSAKTNLGHLEAAAGIAGLIKAALCVRQGKIPPHLNFTQLNPEIDTGSVDLRIPTGLVDWPGVEGRRIAGVSGFGFGGTNAHVVLEAPPACTERLAERTAARAHTLPLSAVTPDALRDLAGAWADWLERTEPPLADATTTAATGRQHFPVRLAVSGNDRVAVAAALRQALPKGTVAEPKVAFVFTGQGAQYAGMAKGAYQGYPAFRTALDRYAAVFDGELGQNLGCPALDLLFGDSSIDDTALAQPLIVAVELALADLWRDWGVTPAAVLGHSVGEISAAAVAGVMSGEDAVRLACARGRLMGGLPEGGGMTAVLAPREAVEPVLQDGLSIAGLNGPGNTVVAGPIAALDLLRSRLDDAGVDSVPLSVSHAFHSALLDPVLPELERIAGAVTMHGPNLPVVSNLTGKPHTVFDGAYWREHARQPVRFEDGVRSLADLGCGVFLEIGPQPVLSGLGARILDQAQWLPSLRKDVADDARLSETLGVLYEAGVAIDWDAVQRDGPGRRIPAPTYRFQRDRYWHDLPSGPRVLPTPANTGPQATSQGGGSAVVYDFYDELTVVSRTYDAEPDAEDDAEGHLTFGFLAEPAPGFSWVKALFEKDEDPVSHALFRKTQRALKDSLFDGIDFSRMRRVFDYGCGHAADLCGLARQYPHLEVAGYTLSAGQVEVGTKRIARMGLSDRVQVHRNDSSAVPFPGNFDLIYGFEVTGLIENKPGLFDNIATHLAPGGVVVIADFVSTGDPISNPETNSFTPSYDEWVDLFSSRKFRLVRAVDTSVEIANWLDDPNFEANIDALVARFGLGELTRRHLLSNGNIGRALRLDVMRYLLLTALHAPHEDAATLAAANMATLRDAVPYRETALGRAAETPWERWLYEIAWRDTPTPIRLPDPAEIAARLVTSVERERMALAAFGDTGDALDRISLGYTIAAFRELGCATVEDATRLKVAAAHARLRDRLVEVLRGEGLSDLPVLDDLSDLVARAASTHPDAEAELALLQRCGPDLAGVLSGRVDPLSLLFPDGDTTLANRLYEASPYSRAVQSLVGEAVAALPRSRGLNVIEIGGGTGATTAAVLDRLPDDSRYLFTDLGGSLVARANDRFGAAPSSAVRMSFSPLDVSRPPGAQGVAVGAFDLAIAANVLHATPDLARTLGHVGEMLAPDGLLMMVENTGRLNWGDLTFGLTEGMWSFSDTDLRDYALLYQEQWRDVLAANGFSDIEILTPGEPDRGGVSQQCVILARRAVARKWVVVDRADASFGSRVADQIGGLCLADVSQIPDDATDVVLVSAIGQDDVLDQASILAPALTLTQTLARMETPPRLNIVSVGAYATPAHATLPGFVRTLAGELPDLRARLIDLDAGTSVADQAHALTDELKLGVETEVALAPGGRRTPVLRRAPVAPAPACALDPSASYLVTGAFGGLGLLVARWLVARGARCLMLVGRNAPGADAQTAIEEISAEGVVVLTARCDVGDRQALSDVVTRADTTAPLKGVIHAAGAVVDASVVWQSWDKVEQVLNAKLRGGWHLHALTKDLELDHFVVFSSAAGLLGPSGQASHAAANSFLDGLAAARRAAGLSALSIDWGAWGEVGAIPRAGVEDHVESTGLIQMAPEQAMKAFGWAMDLQATSGSGAGLGAGSAQVAVLDADWVGYRRRFPLGGVPKLLADVGLIGAETRASRSKDPTSNAPTPNAPTSNAPVSEMTPKQQSWRQAIAATPVGRRMDVLRDAIRAEAARIMRHPNPNGIDEARALRDLGVDSLMSVEMRNALAAKLDHKLPATLLFDHPSVVDLATFIAGDVLADLFVSVQADGDALSGLDQDELSNLLDAELGGSG
jgi:acyl transferase domain-containing protein/NAD(P)-dependent dehydrogenase (short-subunit alcohol dehydrogenase family)/acyl carrier protein